MHSLQMELRLTQLFMRYVLLSQWLCSNERYNCDLNYPLWPHQTYDITTVTQSEHIGLMLRTYVEPFSVLLFSATYALKHLIRSHQRYYQSEGESTLATSSHNCRNLTWGVRGLSSYLSLRGSGVGDNSRAALIWHVILKSDIINRQTLLFSHEKYKRRKYTNLE